MLTSCRLFLDYNVSHVHLMLKNSPNMDFLLYISPGNKRGTRDRTEHMFYVDVDLECTVEFKMSTEVVRLLADDFQRHVSAVTSTFGLSVSPHFLGELGHYLNQDHLFMIHQARLLMF